MRILVAADVPPDPNSGAAGTVCATNSALRQQGHQVDEIWDRDLPHRIRHWNLHYLLELPRGYRAAVRQRCRRGQYDVIQLSQPHGWLVGRDREAIAHETVVVNRSHGLESLADIALLKWRRELGEPENRFPRSLLSPVLRTLLHRHIDLAARYCDGMIVPANDIRDHLVAAHGTSEERVRVIPHGVPDSFLKTPWSPGPDSRMNKMLYVGQYAFIKGPGLLARAIVGIFRENRKATMTWVCSRRDHGSVRALFPDDAQSQLTLLDWVDQEGLISLYDEHAIHLAHSIYEGAAKACVEAMSRGQVVICSRVGAMKDLIVHGQNGFLVEVGDSKGMQELALEVMADPGRARGIADAARASTTGLSWDRCAAGAVEFYEALRASRTGGRGR